MNEEFTPEVIVSLILLSLKKNAEEYIGKPVKDAIVSVPVNFSIKQKKALLKAYHLAGINIIRMVTESSIISYLLSETEENNYLILDIGGGTSDISLIETGDNAFEILGGLGKDVGGVDYDKKMVECISNKINMEHKILSKNLNPIDQLKIKNEAIRAKIALTNLENTSVILENITINKIKERDIQFNISRIEYNNFITTLDDEIENLLIEAKNLCDEYKFLELNSILLTGQGSKFYSISNIINKVFPSIPIIKKYKETAVVEGISYQCGVLSGEKKDALLLDMFYNDIWLYINPSNYGLLIHNNTTIPAKQSMMVLVTKSGKINLEIKETNRLHSYDENIKSIELFFEKGDKIELTIYIDANSKIELIISCKQKFTQEVYQLF